MAHIFTSLRTGKSRIGNLSIMSLSRIPARWIAISAKRSMIILDDYLDIALPHFSHIPSERLAITSSNIALPAFNHPDTTDSQRQDIIDRLKPFDIISSMRERTPFPSELLNELTNLKLLLATGTQFETFDIATAKRLGITIAAAPGRGRTDGRASHIPPRPKLDIKQGGSHPTTQHAWALILALARNVAADDAAMKGPGKKWQTGLAMGLTGTTLGVVGLGRLGAAVARIAILAFGMRVICWSENLTQKKADSMAENLGLPAVGGCLLEPDANTFLAVSKEELFRKADVVTIHYVLSERSRGIVGRAEFEAMKNSALIVNTSRGPLIDQRALLHALEQGEIKGAAMDVFDVEPLPRDSPWRSTRWGSRLLVTPHMGYVEEGIMHIWYEETAENVERWLQGQDVLHRLK